MTNQHPSIPSSTYRLQFNKGFTFTQAREIVAYLDNLGISHCYSSPYFMASPDSSHGYDIADHNKLNPAIGSREEYDAFVEELRRFGMGQVVDFVPNHMGIADSLNRWWMDVLENGPGSVYAPYFDIDWLPLKDELRGKVLLPILGDQYGRALERGELEVAFQSGSFFVKYYGTRLPVAPRTHVHVLRKALDLAIAGQPPEGVSPTPQGETADPGITELRSILTALDHLPSRNEVEPEKVEERLREKEVIRLRLARLCDEQPHIAEAVQNSLKEINGTVGNARSFDALDALLSAQPYRLSYWKVAAEEINYRRFFDINNLAAIRMERKDVFDATHRFIFELIASGAVTGLRIDHVDGLWNPREYLEQLQKGCAALFDLDPASRGLYLLVEKILIGSEPLRQDWPVHGTTGYDFTIQAISVLVDSTAEKPITSAYQRFVGEAIRFEDMVYETKRQTMRLSLASEINVLGSILNRLSEQNRWYRDFTLNALTTAVREVIACFPVYRTYLVPGEETSEEDRQIIHRAVAAAKRRNPALERSIFDFLRDILLMRFPENINEEAREEHVRFVLKFQQCTGPIMAKGLEDTAFYIYNRLVALNEVGGEPQKFGSSVEAYHRLCLRRHADSPNAMLATSTHDTKRSEDTRARIAAISEMPGEWKQALQRWKSANRKSKRAVEGRFAPDANEEYLLYQMLLGTWPLQPMSGEERQGYVVRIQDYMTKAIKEAKVNSSWIEPNEPWDEAVRSFVAAILEPGARNKFLPSFASLADRIAQAGAINSLSQVTLKCTTPGVPDIYQGTEIWDFSMVDPDNRRPVDYAARARMIDDLASAHPPQLFESWRSGAIKLFVTRTLLRFRRENAALFAEGSYTPLEVSGAFMDCCIAFRREWADQVLVVAVPRLASRVGFPPIGELWQDTALVGAVPTLRNLFTGGEIVSSEQGVSLSQVFADFPVAVLIGSKTAAS